MINIKAILATLLATFFLLSSCQKTPIEPMPPSAGEGGVTSLRAKDSLALIAIYKACNGIDWITEYGKLDLWSNHAKPITDTEHWRGITTEKIDGEVRVTKLFLVSCGLKGTLPEEIGNLTELTWLDLSFGELAGKLPSKGLEKLTKLKLLNLSHNTKLDLQPLDFVKDMAQIEKISLTNGNFDAIANNLDKLQSLTELAIDNNKLTELPPSIGKLKKLEKIYASGNKIATLPNPLGELSATLTHLVLYKNKLTELPACILQLNQLTYLDISDNEIKNVNAQEIRKKLPKLNTFNY